MRILAFAVSAAALALWSVHAEARVRSPFVEAARSCVCKPAAKSYRARHVRKRVIVRRSLVARGLRTRILKVIPSIGYDPLPYRFDAVPVRRYVVTRYVY